MVLIVAAPPGTRWCEHEVNPGDVLLDGPGAEHTALSPEGVEYRFALIDSLWIDEVGDAIRTPIVRPAPGSFNRLPAVRAVQELGSQLLPLGDPLSPRGEIPPSGAELFLAMTQH